MIVRRFLLLLLLFVPVAFFPGCASRQVARNLAERSDLIAAKIHQAETQGAKDYAPRELARARVALERALHEASQSYNDPAWINVEFDKAEIAANELLARRSLASMP